MDALGALPNSSPAVSTPFTSSLSSLGVTPGSPAKLVPTLGPASLGPTCQAPTFNTVQPLSNQLQGASFPLTMASLMILHGHDVIVSQAHLIFFVCDVFYELAFIS